jgi:hypothetical protein
VVASAPGYYSQAVALPAGGERQAGVEFRLMMRPETRRIAWGAGEIVVPPETRATLEGQSITLEAGWVWGAGTGGQPVTVETAGVVIEVAGGAFALEAVAGQVAWLYVFEGTAQVSRAADAAERLVLAGGEMLALPAGGDLVAVPIEAVVVQALRAEALALPVVWEPSVGAQVRNRLALVGVTTAQVATLVTYVLAIGALLALPIAGLAWRRRRAQAR